MAITFLECDSVLCNHGTLKGKHHLSSVFFLKIPVPHFKDEGEQCRVTCSKWQERAETEPEFKSWSGWLQSFSAAPGACHADPFMRNEVNISAANLSSSKIPIIWTNKSSICSCRRAVFGISSFSPTESDLMGFQLRDLSKVSGQMWIFREGEGDAGHKHTGPLVDLPASSTIHLSLL